MTQSGAQISRTQLRMLAVMALLLIGFRVVVVRAFAIQVKGKDFYQAQGEIRHVKEVEMPVSRGAIYDRNGEPLALSTAMPSVGIVPGQLIDQFSKVEQLAEVSGVGPKLAQQIYDYFH